MIDEGSSPSSGPVTTVPKAAVIPEAARSVAAILRNQHPGGAFVASPDFGSYRYCWLRDGSFTAYSLDRAGEVGAAERFHHWCAAAVTEVAPLISKAVERAAAGEPVDPADMPPARFSLDGAVVRDDWPNFQVDGYGTWLWALHSHLRAVGEPVLPAGFRPAVEATARYLAQLGTSPCYDVWEESGTSVHTSTLACVYAGLWAAGEMLADPALQARAGQLQRSLLEQAGRDGHFRKSDHSNDVDASLLWLCQPLQVVPPGREAFVETVRRIVTELDLDGGVRRYPEDTYYGGGAWPVLTASLGSCLLSMGDREGARRRFEWVAERVGPDGHLAEQFGGERRDPPSYAQWAKRWGPPAADLTWSHAMLVVLAADLDGRPRETGPITNQTAEPTGSSQKSS